MKMEKNIEIRVPKVSEEEVLQRNPNGRASGVTIAATQNAVRRKINAKLLRVIIISGIVTAMRSAADAAADVSNTVAYACAPCHRAAPLCLISSYILAC